LDETAGQVVYAINDPSEIDQLLQLASDEMQEAIRRFVHYAPQAQAEWIDSAFLVLDGDEQSIQRSRSRLRVAVETLRKRLP
jgi:hypothetical protein